MKKDTVSLLQVCVLVILGVLVSSPVASAAPLITDDTGTQGRGKFELEITGEWGKSKDEAATNRNGDLSAAITGGVADTVDVVFNIPFNSWRSDDSGSITSESGFSDLSLEVKWRFYRQEGLSLAMKPGFTLPTGDSGKDLGNGKMTCYLYIIASEEVEPWEFDFNLAYTRNNNTGDDRRDLWLASIASTFDAGKGLYIVADIGAATNPENASDTPRAYVLGGATYSVSRAVELGLGLKAGLTKSENDLAVRGGVTYRF